MTVERYAVEAVTVEIYPDSEAAGRAAAEAAAAAMRELAAQRANADVVFATGASQLKMLRALTAIEDLPWAQIDGFHLDEYVGIDQNHAASFRRYLREELSRKVKMRNFHEIDGNAADTEKFCCDYAEALRRADPQLCLLGIGENGHLAFNEPAEAEFDDAKAMKVVTLDAECRMQQVAEGWFASMDEVPSQAMTLTIPTLFKIPRLIVSVPGPRKAKIVRRAMEEEISTKCPATILRRHPGATLYLDAESAAELKKTRLLRGTFSC